MVAAAGRIGGLFVEAGGEGEALLLALHGLGATGRVWLPFLVASRWPGRWIAPDLPGHGASSHCARYQLADYVGAISELLRAVAPFKTLTIVGHSLGGAIGVALAGHNGAPAPRKVFGIGIKSDWGDEEIERMEGLSQRESRFFDTPDAALAYHARQAGLMAQPADSPLLGRGIVHEAGGWRAAMDMAAFAVERPEVAARAKIARCPIHLAAGADDKMVSFEGLRAIDSEAFLVPGAGHCAMVDAPGAIWAWMTEHDASGHRA